MDFVLIVAISLFYIFFVAFYAMIFISPIYVAYKRDKNWKKWIIPSLFLGIILLPFANHRKKVGPHDRDLAGTTGSPEFENFLEQDEKIITSFKGACNSREGELVLTDSRILFTGKKNSETRFSVKLEDITRLSYFLSSSVIITGNGLKQQQIFLKKIHIAQFKNLINDMEFYKLLYPTSNVKPPINVDSKQKIAEEEITTSFTALPMPDSVSPTSESVPVKKLVLGTADDRATDNSEDLPTDGPPPPPPPPLFKDLDA
jgi:hypothetical protein